MSERIPCPDCGETQTVELLAYETHRLRAMIQEKKERIKAEKRRIEAEKRRLEEEKRRAEVAAGGGSGGAGGNGGYLTISGLPGTSPIYIGGSGANTTTFNAGYHTHGLGTIGYSSVDYGDWSMPFLQIPTPCKDSSKKTPEKDDFRVEVTGRVNGMECCIGCGRSYNPHVKQDAQKLRSEIEELMDELYSPLERLAQASEEEA